MNIENLCVKVNDKEILNKFNLKIDDGEIHVLMGPNGIGKSTICKTILGDPNYEVVKGDIFYHNKNLKDLSTTERAKLGIFLLNQNPIAIEGVTNADLLRSAIAEKTGKAVNIFDFNKELLSVCKKLDLPSSFIHRDINVGMSGGERKKNELLHLWVLKPSFVILDEIDSGLDVDALKLVANSLKEYHDIYNSSMLIITHHPDLLKILNPNYVHIIKGGTIVKTGDYNLALEIAKDGYSLDKNARS